MVKKNQGGVLKKAEMEITSKYYRFSWDLVRHGLPKDAGASWNKGHELQYHIFFVLEGASLKDAVVVANYILLVAMAECQEELVCKVM